MLISYKWLKDFVQPGLEPDELAEKLTLIGLEIDGVEEHGDDVVFDIEVTSNRGDCLSHLGVAREISGSTGAALNVPEGIVHASARAVEVEIAAEQACHRFTARVIRGIKVGPSPEWLVRRLEAVGERSINNIADITNYVMHELGNPMHAFDFDKLAGGQIIVRHAAEGESIITLDEVERRLSTEMLAICDAEKPVAVAGVMGGLESGIDDDSVNMLLEVAYFDRDLIRSTSSSLGLSTEASYRFERGVDIENLIRASNRATELILELAGGEDAGFCDLYPTVADAVKVEAPDLKDEILRLSGLEMDKNSILGSLNAIGIENDGSTFIAPSWRHDIAIKADLVEEAVRIHGYDKIGDLVPPATTSGEYQAAEAPKRAIRKGLSANGFLEAFSYSFVDRNRQSPYSLLKDESPENGITIDDPIIEGADLMRQTLIPGLVEAAHLNTNFQTASMSLFEIGRVFSSEGEDGLPGESEFLAILLAGSETYADSPNVGRGLEFFDLKGIIENCFEWGRFGKAEFEADDSHKHLQNGQSASVYIQGMKVGSAGKLSAKISAEHKFKQDVFVAELDLSTLISLEGIDAIYTQLPKYPATKRDVSLVVPSGTTFGSIRNLFTSESIPFLRSVFFIDEYQGQEIADGERNMTVRFEYRSEDSTITDEQADRSHKRFSRNWNHN